MKALLLFGFSIFIALFSVAFLQQSEELIKCKNEIAVKDSIINQMNEKWVTPEYIGDTTITLNSEWKYLKIRIVSN